MQRSSLPIHRQLMVDGSIGRLSALLHAAAAGLDCGTTEMLVPQQKCFYLRRRWHV